MTSASDKRSGNDVEGDGEGNDVNLTSEENSALENDVERAILLRDSTLDEGLKFEVSRLQLPGFEEFVVAVKERMKIENKSIVSSTARELIAYLEGLDVLDMRSYYAGQVQYELRGVFQGAEDYCKKEEGVDEVTVDSVTLEIFLKDYLCFSNPLFLTALKAIINVAITDGEKLRLQAAYLKQIRKHAGEVDALKEEASIDVLTQLWNRAAYEKHIAEIRKEDSNGKYFFLMLDLDKFKNVNDTYGHSNGDVVLQAFSAVLRRNVRGGKIKEAFRIGGEEMVVMCRLPDDIDAKKAEELAVSRANQIREAMKAELLTFEVDGEFVDHTQTVSIGVSVCRGEYLSSDEKVNGEAYDAADRALFEAKENGRDQVQIGDRYM